LFTVSVFSHHDPCALAAGTNHTANVGTFNLITESSNYKMDLQETQLCFSHISFNCSRPTVSFAGKQLCFQLLSDCTKLRSNFASKYTCMTLHIMTVCINTSLLIHLLPLIIYLLMHTSHQVFCQLSAQGESQTDAHAFKYLYKFNVHRYSKSNYFIFKCHILALSTSRHIYFIKCC
jgi:hypothetical protein